MDKPTLLDLHPAIIEEVTRLYFEGMPVEEALEQAKKEYEGASK